MQSKKKVTPSSSKGPKAKASASGKSSISSLLKKLILAGLLLFIVGAAGVYMMWDYMPDRVHYIASRVEAEIFPPPPPPASVPTPVGAAAPEDLLKDLDLGGDVGEAAAEEVEPEPTASAPAEVAAAEEAPAEATEEPVAEAAPAEEEGAPSEEEGAPAEEEGAPAEEEGAPAEEEGAPAEEEGAPAEEEGAPAEEEGAPAEEEGAPSEEEGAPAEEEGPPSEEEGAPSEEEGAPSEEEGAPSEEEGAPSEEEENAEGGSTEEAEAFASEEEASAAATEEADASAPESAEEPEVEPLPEPIHIAADTSAQLAGVKHEYQGWNNCGPATLAMQLSFFGRSETQVETAEFLKPNKDDKNVSPDELVAYADTIDYNRHLVVGADLDLLRTFVTNEFPVMVESWYIPDPDDEMGHYLLLTGYEGDTLTFFDSYHGPGVQEQAAEFDEMWKVFNRTAVVVWPPERDELAYSILGELADSQTMHERALATAHSEVQANPQDKFAWFNLGTNLLALGDLENSAKAFDTARSLELPWRMLWYQFGPYEAYYENGRYEEVISLTTTTLENADNLEESYYWRGRAQAALGKHDEARSDFEEAAGLNSNFAPAKEALNTLP